ncbi:hypothetical protein VTN77DRAFT_8433 [Rasamsonia byssochlamydoides]|uniref:uncharacterized protein n=1 Tax=Rasamsonia byssochlamydoides TaxID=89139 RepID=UPI003742A8FF
MVSAKVAPATAESSRDYLVTRHHHVDRLVSLGSEVRVIWIFESASGQEFPANAKLRGGTEVIQVDHNGFPIPLNSRGSWACDYRVEGRQVGLMYRVKPETPGRYRLKVNVRADNGHPIEVLSEVFTVYECLKTMPTSQGDLTLEFYYTPSSLRVVSESPLWPMLLVKSVTNQDLPTNANVPKQVDVIEAGSNSSIGQDSFAWTADPVQWSVHAPNPAKERAFFLPHFKILRPGQFRIKITVTVDDSRPIGAVSEVINVTESEYGQVH